MIGLAVVVVAIAVLVVVGPGLGDLRRHLAHASGGWLVGAVVLEVLSALSYVVIFRAVFCPRMSWRLSYRFGMAEQAANSVLSVSGVGGLALGVWALRRGGMSTDYIARRTVAFFFLTSLANVWTLILFAVLFAVGVFPHDRNVITYGFGGAALVATLIVMVGLPRLQPRPAVKDSKRSLSRRLKAALRFARNSLGQGVRDSLLMMRERPVGVFGGSFSLMGFDIAVLGLCFLAFGHPPPLGVLVAAYLIGQLAGNIPIPGGIGALDAGLIGALVVYHQPLAASTAAVLIYRAIALWIPGLLGSVAVVRLGRTLRLQEHPAVICMPLADPIVTVSAQAATGRSVS